MASDPKYGLEPPTDSDGNYKDVLGQFGFLYLLADGHTLEDVRDGTQYDLADIGGGSTTDTRVDVADDGSVVASDATTLNLTQYLSASSDGSGGADVSVALPSVSDDNGVVLDPFEDLAFGPEFTVTDDGDGTATVATTDSVVRTRQAQVPLTEIADGNTAVGLQKHVPDGATLEVLEVGVQDDTESAPAGLTIEVQDLTGASAVVSENSVHSSGSPLGSVAGPVDVQVRVGNATGGSLNASGYVLYTME